MRSLVAALVSALVILGPAGTSGAADPVAPAIAPAFDDAELVQFVEDFVDALDESQDLLDMFETQLLDGLYGPTTDADFETLETFRDRLDDLANRAVGLDPATDGELYGAQIDLWGEFEAFWTDLDPFLTALGNRAGGDPFMTVDPNADEIILFDPPSTTALARRTAALVFEEARILLALGAFPNASEALAELTRLVEIPIEGDRASLIAQLDTVDARAAEGLATLAELTPAIGPATKQAVARLLPGDRQRIVDGAASPVGSDVYLRAIESLLTRNGRPTDPGAELPKPPDLASQLRAELMTLETTTVAEPVPPATTASAPADQLDTADTTPADTTPADTTPADTTPAETDTAAAAASTDGGRADGTATPAAGDGASDPSDDGSGDLVLIALIVAGLLAVAAIVALLWRRRRRSSSPKVARPGFEDLLDVSRRLAGAETVVDVERLAVQQSMRLTGALAGAYIRHENRKMVPGYTTDEGLLVTDRLGDGVLGRVIGSGRELMQVSQTEPAIRNLPVSLLAAPVVARATIIGAILLVRSPDDPFAESDLAVLTDLEPIVGSAMESTMLAEESKAEALTDGLTGVRNRRALDLAIERCGDDVRFAAVMVDLDHFKAVNDTFGHQGGDDLLRAAARRITANVRPSDEVYRYGGEEFAIVMTGTDEAAAATIAERIREAIAGTPFVIGPDRIEHTATASFGVAAGTGGAAVFASADTALYEAKAAGRDRVMRAGVPA